MKSDGVGTVAGVRLPREVEAQEKFSGRQFEVWRPGSMVPSWRGNVNVCVCALVLLLSDAVAKLRC